MELWRLDFHPLRDDILYGTINLKVQNVNEEEHKAVPDFKAGKYINVAKYNNDGTLCASGDIDGVMSLYQFKDEYSDPSKAISIDSSLAEAFPK
mmetsp:Transcript_3681/g.4505  ORF Transcript_3681/g.4505 Transcript_3681/m.4505 type:complete len:94 (+) Transcript_3681:335-616(+)